MKRETDDLAGAMDMLFALHQAKVAFAATQRRASLTAGEVCELKKERSSAYMVFSAAVSGMSAQKNANKVGDRQEPCGTPDRQSLDGEREAWYVQKAERPNK